MTIQYSTKKGNNYGKRKNKENPAVCHCQTEKSGQIDHQRSELLKILPISYFENSGQNHGFDPNFQNMKSEEFSVILTVGGRFGRFFRSDSGKI